MSHTPRLHTALVLLPLAALLLSACSTAVAAPEAAPTEIVAPTHTHGTDEADDAVVTIGLKFEPKDITVAAGTTVYWHNGETITHTITSGAWGDVNESTGLRGTQTPDGLFDHTLAPMDEEGDTPGTYYYYCQPHLTMNATITVTP